MGPRPIAQDWCIFVRERLELFLDGELSGSENLSVTTHLKECEECGRYWADDEKLALVLLASAPNPKIPAPVERRDDVRVKVPVFNIRRGARWSLAAAVLVTVFLGVSRLVSTSDPSSLIDAVESPGTIQVLSSQGQVAAVSWRLGSYAALRTGMTLTPLDRLRTAADSQLELALGFGSTCTLSENSEFVLAGIGSAEADATLELEQGRIFISAASGGVAVKAAGVSIQGCDSGFEVNVDRRTESVSVVLTRGEVEIQCGDGARIYKAPLVVLAERGQIVPRDIRSAPSTILFQDIENRLETLQRELHVTRTELASVRDENQRLRSALELPSRGDVDPVDTPDTVISEYLETVELSNHLDVTKPNAYTQRALSDLRNFGPVAVAHLSAQMDRENQAIRRTALAGLLGYLEYQECFEPLMRASFDREEEVRAAVWWLLDRTARPELIDHFMAVYRFESVPWLKARAAYSAAKLGADAALTALTADYFEAQDHSSRMASLHMLARLADRPSVQAFLRRIVSEWRPGVIEGGLRIAVKTLIEVQDAAALPLLREILSREGLPNDVRRFIDESLQRLQTQSLALPPEEPVSNHPLNDRLRGEFPTALG